MEEEKKLIAIDINLEETGSKGIAYYRLDDGLFKFLQLCEKKEKIIGFEWNGSRDFGVILGEEKDEK